MTPLPQAEAWLPLLARHAELFADLEPGARIGVTVRRRGEDAEPPAMVVWEAGHTGMTVQPAIFPGFARAGVDVLLVGDDEALAEISRSLAGDALPVMRRHIRQGGLVSYLLRRQCDLLEAGYETLLTAFGVAFMGACR
ncbi:MAG: hypothetical protein HYU60_06975 [Magnetospirillum sp.]|nr:hypothetical protein [Magnetospirillum sp.]